MSRPRTTTENVTPNPAPHLETARLLEVLTAREKIVILAVDEHQGDERELRARRLMRGDSGRQVGVVRYLRGDRRKISEAVADNIQEVQSVGLLHGYVSLHTEREQVITTADIYVGEEGVLAAAVMNFAAPGEKKLIREERATGMRQTFEDAELFGVGTMWTRALLQTWYEYPPQQWTNQTVNTQDVLHAHQIEQMNSTLQRFTET